MGDDFTKIPRPFYPPLSALNREIRLLHLQPGDEALEIQCRLSVVSIDSNPLYEALSYTWGDLNNTSSIAIDGHDVLIPSNLKEGLRRVRFNDSERALWADAICIDQSSIAERNHQVALMADIYRNCERCLVWLGQTDLEATFLDSLSELLGALSEKRHLDQPEAPRISPMLGLPRSALMFMNLVAWWNRIWVVQEVILAPQSLIFFGSFEMRFSDLVSAVEFVNHHDMRGAWYASSEESDQVCGCMDHIKVTFVWAELLTLRDHIYRLLEVTIPPSEVKVIRSTSLPSTATIFPDFINVLLSARNRACTDPRDKIFGMLSLVTDRASWPIIKADYSKDDVTVFTEIAAQMISSDYGVRTLLLVQSLDPESRNLAGLPTWVPDWTKSGTGHDKYLLDIDTAVSHDSQRPVILGSTLTLHGLSRAKITRISTAGSPPSASGGFPSAETFEDWKVFAGSLESWRNFAGVKNSLSLQGVLNRRLSVSRQTREIDPQAESRSYARLMRDIKRSDHTVDFPSYVKDFFAVILEYQEDLQRMEPDEEAFYRTLLYDIYPLRLQLSQYHKEALCILRILLILMLACVDPDRVLTRLNSVVLTKMNETLEMLQTFRKRLFWTDNGCLGIGSDVIVTGDEIFSFDGVETPFVLRTVGMREVDGEGSQHCYELVGICYLDGLKRDKVDIGNGTKIYLQ
jgi:Heterokaryon incompatibility protein (HET)